MNAESIERTIIGKPLIILHVEDNNDHADLVARTLTNHCVANKIKLVCDGQAALDYLFRRGEFTDPVKNPRPTLVLLDLRLPKIDGLDVLSIIKTTDELSSIPVVVLTSSEAEIDLVRAYKYHANSYLVKPVGFEEFSHMMGQLGFYWLCWNRYPWLTEEEVLSGENP
ncbi:MAG: response regulator [Pirellulales bacterium]|nr:response regulator [Pirellulales bacterium]